MYTDEKLEKHYSSMSSKDLHIIRDEFKFQEECCGAHYGDVLQILEKVLGLRGESLEVRSKKKILFLCRCGQSRIVEPDVSDDKIKMFIFEQYNVPCAKCKSVSQYSWKYLE